MRNSHRNARSVACVAGNCRSHRRTRRVQAVRWPADGTARPAVRQVMRSARSEEHTSELQSLMRISYAVFCLKKKKQKTKHQNLHRKKKHRNNTVVAYTNKLSLKLTQSIALKQHNSRI